MEDDQIEILGENNPSILDFATRLRPFSPPFAQMNRPNSKEKAEQKKVTSNKTKQEGHRNNYEKKKTIVYDPILKCYYDPKSGNYYPAA